MSATPAYLGTLSWPDLDPQRGLLLAVPLGSCEQHGPHLPLDTDTRIAVALADAARRPAAPEVVVAPAVAYGSSGEHAGFPGTLSIGQAALELVLVELCRSADAFAGVVLVNGHGGNAAPVGPSRGDPRPPRDAASCRGGRRSPGATPTPGGPRRRCCSPSTRTAVRLDRAEPGDTAPLSELLPDAAPRRRAGGGAQRRARRPDRRLGGRGPGAARRRSTDDLVAAVDGWLAA